MKPALQNLQSPPTSIDGSAGCHVGRRLRLDDQPTPPLQLGGQLLGRQPTNGTLGDRRPSGRRRFVRRSTIFSVGFELIDESSGLVAGEVPGGLALGKPHRASCVTEAGVTGRLEERQELMNLLRRRRWS
jgi:hypothetical protein